MIFDNIIQGDCLEVMKSMDAECIDLIVTDPPYGYSFMGKDWDKAIVGVPTWKECLRVLKPGSFAFVMSAPRQDVLSRMMINLDNAGFDIGFTSIYWAYATGFPKAMNMGKAVDKRLGINPNVLSVEETKSGGFGHMMKTNVEQGYRPNDYYKETGNVIKRTEPASEQAKKLEGSYAGFQPKPAVEVIIVCMKPLIKKNYVEQALNNGKGVTWLNDCRIPVDEKDNYDLEQRGISKATGIKEDESFLDEIHDVHSKHGVVEGGRFPANLLVSDNVLDDGLEHKSGKMDQDIKGKQFNTYGKMYDRHVSAVGGSGSFNRYFDLDKWWANFIITPKPSKSEKNRGLENFEKKDVQPAGLVGAIAKGTEKPREARANNHPTVKPIKLMSYLITLGSREGDIVLDPFMGSGTTCLSASLLGRTYIGIEREEEYCKIARGRLDGLLEQSNIG